jgi:tubulin polyglutamylase TTLL6/13
MYLFHDGLVRMCTEEYVKPTKQNINNVCMHLTNYAVNKHNENFQQPSVASSEDQDGQDSGSKRSLLWFMNHVRKEYGDNMADWLWKRMGILCTRTILSIMPTLSREYDQLNKF